jgi:hypothetical protein
MSTTGTKARERRIHLALIGRDFAPCGARVQRDIGDTVAIVPSTRGLKGDRDPTCPRCLAVAKGMRLSILAEQLRVAAGVAYAES